MKKNDVKNAAIDSELQEILDKAEMAATVEQAEQNHEEENHSVESVKEQEAEAVDAVENDHIIILSKEYEFDGEKIDRLDFSKLPDLTTRDLVYADRILARLQHDPADKFKDTLWAKYIASHATGYVPEFFDELSMRDMLGIVGTIRTYFLIGWE